MITIVTDSSAYFKKKEAQELNVKIIPCNYSVDGRTYCESFSDQNGDFEALLKGKAKLTTSHPNLSAFLSCFEEEKDNDILCVTISSRLSGAYGTAYAAAKQTEGKNIAVFDSQLTAGGLYLLIKEARRMIESGLEFSELLESLAVVREKISITFSVNDMTPLRKSGRMGFMRMGVSTIMNIRPILMCLDGAVVYDQTVRGNGGLIERLFQKADANAREIIISYLGDNRLAADLFNVIHNMYPHITVALQKIGPVLGIHLGLRVVAVSILKS